MEEALTHRSKADLEHLMEEISGALRNILTTKHRKFDGETQEVKNIWFWFIVCYSVFTIISYFSIHMKVC